jgi:uncharacterized membrane protein (DUF2068 family)
MRGYVPDAIASVKQVAVGRPRSCRTSRAVRVVAVLEAFKGIVVLLAATGLLALVHRDLDDFAVRLVQHAHLNPASRWPHIFLDAVSHLDQPRLLWLAVGAAAYGAVRLVEAYGLFRERAWAEWLSALSGGLYVPMELVELARQRSLLSLVLLAVNLVVVAVMVRALMQRRSDLRRARDGRDAHA